MDLGRDKVVCEVVSRLAGVEGAVVKAEGTWGSFGPLLAAHISGQIDKPILYIAPHIDDADRAADDVHTFGVAEAETLNAWEGEEDLADATDQIRVERLRLVSNYAGGGPQAAPPVIVTSIQALCQPVPKPELFAPIRNPSVG